MKPLYSPKSRAERLICRGTTVSKSCGGIEELAVYAQRKGLV